jgi:hypothetical protein
MEGHRLRVFGNRALRKIFWPKWEDIRMQRCKPQNKELHDKEGVKFAGHVAGMGTRKGAYRSLVRKPEGKIKSGTIIC